MFVGKDVLPVGQFTVLAPTNRAFEKLPAGTIDNLLKPENKATLVNTLTYYIVGKYTSADLYDGLTLTTVERKMIKFTKVNRKLTNCRNTISPAIMEQGILMGTSNYNNFPHLIMPQTFPANSQVHFYKDLVSIDDFMDSLNPLSYSPAPESWSVLITDIKGSTKAIEAGKYRDVNTLGACTITTVINVLPDLDIPYVFGGDGATLLIPTACREKLTEELLRLQAYARRTFDLELRLGIVPIVEILKQGGEVLVAKYHLGNGNNLALFRGGGISLAEKWIKGMGPNGENYGIEMPENSPSIANPPNLHGLSCRWSPFENKNGSILTLLIKAKNPSEETMVYQEFLDLISLKSQGNLHSFCPVQIDGRQFSSYDPTVNKLDGKLQEAVTGKFGRIKSFYYSCITKLAIKLDIKIGGFEPKRYIEELVYQVDYKKFDDMLRFVLDCSEEQKKSILTFLEEQHKIGKLYFGYHVSQTSLMTCLVFNYEQGRHIHFIDGDHGGYTLAAVGFKAQMKADEK